MMRGVMKGVRPSLVICLVLLVGCKQQSLGPAVSDSWVDHSPHKQGFVTANGVKLEYLDWGGTGEPLVFLAGLGLTAHIYDEIAPELAKDFHVVGLTRRGFGTSEKPTDSYELATLVEDIRQALDSLGIRRAILVGHSFGVQEAAAFAAAFPERVSRVVYLDGAYHYSPEIMKVSRQLSAFAPQPDERAVANVATLIEWNRQNVQGWNDACEADFRATRIRTPDGIHVESSSLDFEKFMDAAMRNPPDFSKVAAPTLSIFADHRLDTSLAERIADAKNKPMLRQMQEMQREQIQRFKEQAPNAKVVELVDTDHMCFTQRPTEVIKEIRVFLKADGTANDKGSAH
jgi:pimeloyl-ACP methyl ester carboxylesterase